MSYNFNSIPSVAPPGSITPYIGTTDPSGWAICDGTSRSNTTGLYNNLINAGLINQNSFGTNSAVPYSFEIVGNSGNSVACSADGRVVIVSISNSSNQGGYPYISRDYGITYTRLTASNFIGQALNTGAASYVFKVSANGNNIAIRQDRNHFSSDSGNTFFNTSNLVGCLIGCSSDLKYITALNYTTLYLSSTYGMSFYLCSTFNKSSFSAAGIAGGTIVGISDNGSTLMHAWYNAGDYGLVIYSLDGGTTWLTSSTFNGTGTKNRFFQGGISPNGQIWSFNSWLSTDTGNTWKSYPNSANAQDMYVLNDNRTIVYPYNYNGTWVYKTTDYGTTTQTLLTGILGIAIAQSVANYSTFYITGGKKTTNNGNTFTRPDTISYSYLPATYNFNQIATSQNGQLILAGNSSPGLLYLSTNRGYSWAIQNNSLSANWYTAAMSGTTGQYQLAGSNSFLYLSTNTGTTWQQISGSQYGSTYGLFTTTTNWWCSAISNAGQYMLAGMNTGNLYMSTSFGIKWTLLGGAANTNGMPTSSVLWNSCSINASGSLMAAAVSTGAVYLSTNSGTNWSTAYGLSTSSPWSKVSIASSANYITAAANSGNIFLSTDGAGATWSQKTGPIGNPIIVVAGQGTNSLAYSYDGINYTGLGTTVFTTSGNAVASNGSRWVAVGSGGCSIAYSDNGITWTQADAGALVFSTAGQCVTWDGIRWLAGGLGSNYIASSTNNGVSWTPINTGQTIGAQGITGIASSGSTWIAAGYGITNIIKSTDSGNSWTTQIVAGAGGSWGVTYANNTWILSTNSNYIYYSTNGAATFALAPSANSIFIYNGFASAYSPTQNKWVAIGQANSANFAAYSTNGGVTWIPSANGTSIMQNGTTGSSSQVFGFVAWTGTYWVAAGGPISGQNNSIAYSADGITWTGIGTSIFSTYGHGVAWNGLAASAPANVPLTAQAWQSLAISGDGTKLIAGTNGSVIYASTTSGQTWTNIGGSSNTVGLPNGTSNWSSMSISQDGSTWLADVTNAQLYISTDGQGKLWGIKAAYNILGTGTWNALTISQDGTTVLAGNTSSNLYISYDSGNTYNALSSNGNLIGARNWTGSAISQNNQIMAACATGDYPYLSSNSGLTWSNQVSAGTYTVASATTFGQSWAAVQPTTLSGVGQNWTLIPASTGISTSLTYSSVAMSSTGQFMIATASTGTPYLSTNYGANWSTSASFASGNYNAASMSYTGQYIFCYEQTSKVPYVSSSYGTYFTALSANASGTASGTSAMSATGQYIIGNQKLSSNYGVNWFSPSSGTTVNAQGTAVSATGQYIIFNCTFNQSLLSTNYGVNWIIDPAGQGGGSQQAGNACISASGQFMFIMGYVPLKVYFSSTFGSTWTTYPGTGLNSSYSNYTVSISATGQYMVVGASNVGATINYGSLLSTNYGANWITISSLPVSYVGISAVSATGQYMLTVNGAAGGAVYISAASVATTQAIINVQSASYYTATSYGLPANYNGICCSTSGTGQYMLAGGRGTITYLSTNYGFSWISTAISTGTDGYNNINNSGQYMAITTASTLRLSSDYGKNFTNVASIPGMAPGIAISDDGKYILTAVGNGTLGNVYLSTNYGISGSWVTNPGTGISGTNNWYQPCMSSTGQYMGIGGYSGTNPGFYLSNNFGNNWTKITAIPTTWVFHGSSMSSSGQYIIVCAYGTGGVAVSNNYGSTWTLVANSATSTNLPDAGTTYSYIWASMTTTGQYMYVWNNGIGTWYSSNYGVSFAKVITLYSTTPYGGAVSGNGLYFMLLQYGVNVFISPLSQTAITNALSTFGPDVAFQQIAGTPTNVGQNFVTNPGTGLPVITNSTFAMSGNGQYILLGDCGSTGGVFITNNTGTSWSQLTTTNGFAVTPTTVIGQNQVCMSNSGQYMIVPAATYLYYSTNYGAYFKTIATSGVNLLQLAMSGNGQYILYATGSGNGNYGFSFSTNFGASFQSNIPVTGFGAAISYSGQYIIIGQNIYPTTTPKLFVSSNFGVTFSSGFTTTLTNGSLYGTYVSYTGQFMLSYMYLSTDFGVNFTATSATGRFASASLTGQYMTSGMSLSTNYGAYWTSYGFSGGIGYVTDYAECVAFQGSGGFYLAKSTIPFITTSTVTSPTRTMITIKTSYGTTWVTNPGTGLPTTFSSASSAVSGNGQYMFISDGSTSAGVGTFLSSNFGNTWTQLGTTNGFSTATIIQGVLMGGVSISSTGQYMAIVSTNNYLYVSSNFGAYFTGYLSSGSNLQSVTMSGDGRFIAWISSNGSNTGNLYLSTDSGASITNLSTLGNVWGGGISYDGQYMLFGAGTNSNIYLSTSYGKYFTTKTATQPNGQSFIFACVSGTGKYMYISNNANPGWLSSDFGATFQTTTATTSSFYCCISYTGQFIFAGNYLTTNYGVSWNSVTLPEGFRTYGISYYGEYLIGSGAKFDLSSSVSSSAITASVVPNPYWYSVTTDSTGQYVVVGSIMNQGIWYSTDYATTWQNSNQILGTIQQLANSGTYMLAAINNISGVYYSSNYGAWWNQSAMPNSNTYASVAMSSSSTYAIAGSLYGGVIYSSTYGQTWQSSNLTTGTYNAVAINPTGQYALASNNTTIYYSTNFGQTFTISNQTSVNTQSLSVSSSGQYAIAGTTAGIYYSMNFGQTWTISNQTVGTWYGINMMSSGQYVVAGNAGQGLWYSLNFGQTWTQSTTNTTDTWYQISTTPTGSYLYAVSQSDTIYQETNVTGSISLSLNGLPTNTSSWQTVAMDSTGQYQLLGINSGFLYYTNTFGNAWSTISGQSPMTGSYNSGNGLPTVALAWNTTRINSTGQYALAGINNGALYMSTNFATNWTPISGLGPLGTTGPWLASNYGFTTNSLAWQTTAMNSSGQYMMAGSNNNYLYLTTNTGTYWYIIGGSAYGSSFGQGLPTVGGAWYTSAISSTGQYMGTGLYGGAFYFSKNYGQAWTAFTNSPLSSAVNWYSMSMASSGTSIVASSNGSNIYNMTTMTIPTATYTPPQISNINSTEGTGLKYIIKL